MKKKRRCTCGHLESSHIPYKEVLLVFPRHKPGAAVCKWSPEPGSFKWGCDCLGFTPAKPKKKKA